MHLNLDIFCLKIAGGLRFPLLHEIFALLQSIHPDLSIGAPPTAATSRGLTLHAGPSPLAAHDLALG